MKFTDEAKREIEKNLNETVRNISAGDKERQEIADELRSTYYEAAKGEALARGSDEVTLDDARAVKARISSPRETADCLMKSYASTLKRAGFWPRLAAFIIDCAFLFVLMLVLISPIFIAMLLLGLPLWTDSSWQIWDGSMSAFNSLIMTVAIVFSSVTAMIILFGYFIVLEAHYGYTAGKRLMGLRVLTTGGTKIGYKEALLRNLAKFNNNLLFLDVLLMLIFFRKEKQRGSDRIADTMVVHVRA